MKQRDDDRLQRKKELAETIKRDENIRKQQQEDRLLRQKELADRLEREQVAETVRIAERMADIERERAKQKMEKERLKKDKEEWEQKQCAEKLIACFPKIGNGTDLEVALDNLEDVLKQANVPENE